MNDPVYATMYLTNFTKSYVAVFFQDTVVMVFIEKERKKLLSKNLKAEMKLKGVGVFNSKAYTRDYYDRFAASYINVERNQSLNENKNCFAIPYSQLEQLKFRPYRGHSNKAHQDEDAPGEIWFNTFSKKYHFNHKYMRDAKVIGVLQQGFKERFVLLKA